jgi:hypothetical protein
MRMSAPFLELAQQEEQQKQRDQRQGKEDRPATAVQA